MSEAETEDFAESAAEALVPALPVKGAWYPLTRLFWGRLANWHEQDYWGWAKLRQREEPGSIPSKTEYETVAGFYNDKLRARIVRAVADELRKGFDG